MKNKKSEKKCYVIIVSKYFPKYHPKANEATSFLLKILNKEKKHTLRKNYSFWEKRMKAIENDEAYLSIRYWTGKPYNSKQEELLQLTKADGIGIQKLEDPDNFVFAEINEKENDWIDIATNDGLSFKDFCDFFPRRQKEPMAIIHFTKFRY
jgi:hypothetical protein